ncbi:MAG: hypothetical protein AAF488_12770 [Planctomycetota bacterium]
MSKFFSRLMGGMAFTVGLCCVRPSLVADEFIRSDCDGDSNPSIADAVFLVNYLFVDGAPSPLCADACDTNDDGQLDVGDVIFMASWLKSAGAPSVPPPLDCGEDPTPDGLGCLTFTACP